MKKLKKSQAGGTPSMGNGTFTRDTKKPLKGKGGAVSTTGYKSDSPDKNNSFNVVPSSRITMNNVPHPVIGTDNTGFTRLMMPGGEYLFPGDFVTEVPVRKDGGGIQRFYLRQTGGAVDVTSGNANLLTGTSFVPSSFGDGQVNPVDGANQGAIQVSPDSYPNRPQVTPQYATPPVPQQQPAAPQQPPPVAAPGQRGPNAGDWFALGVDAFKSIGQTIGGINNARNYANYVHGLGLSDNAFASTKTDTVGNKGDYVATGTGTGQFRPNQMTPATPWSYAQDGGPVTPEERLAYNAYVKNTLQSGSTDYMKAGQETGFNPRRVPAIQQDMAERNVTLPGSVHYGSAGDNRAMGYNTYIYRQLDTQGNPYYTENRGTEPLLPNEMAGFSQRAYNSIHPQAHQPGNQVVSAPAIAPVVPNIPVFNPQPQVPRQNKSSFYLPGQPDYSVDSARIDEGFARRGGMMQSGGSADDHPSIDAALNPGGNHPFVPIRSAPTVYSNPSPGGSLDIDAALKAVAATEGGRTGQRTNLTGPNGQKATASGVYQMTDPTVKSVWESHFKNQYPTYQAFKKAYDSNPNIEYATARAHMADLSNRYGIYALGAWYSPDFAQKAADGDNSVYGKVPAPEYGNKTTWGQDFNNKLQNYEKFTAGNREYKRGGEYEVNDAELRAILAAGGEVEYL